jgi:hypothetical protein
VDAVSHHSELSLVLPMAFVHAKLDVPFHITWEFYPKKNQFFV